MTKERPEDFSDFSLFEALESLSFEPKDPSTLHSWEEVRPPPTPTSTRTAVPSKSSTLRKSDPSNNNQLTRTQTKAKMSVSKSQTQCLERCHKTTAQTDRIAIRFLEALTSERHLPHGINGLAHDFLDTCQILFAIEAGLTEYNRAGRDFPSQMVTELDSKFRVTQADFQILDQMLVKQLGASGLKRSWGKLFGDTDIHKLTNALSKTRESLRMSSLVFQWSLGQETIDREMGIGYTGLAAALDRMDHKGENATARGTNNNSAQPPVPTKSAVPLRLADSQMVFPLPPNHNDHNYQPWSDRSSSIQHEPPPSPYQRPPLGADFRHNSATATNMSSARSNASTKGDTRSSVTAITEYDTVPEDLSRLDHGPLKVVRVRADPASMPRCYIRNIPEPDAPNAKAALISAVRSKDHKLVEQFLNQGISPDVQALREAIIAHDEETVRLFLYFGANPNDADTDGITPLFAAVKESFASGATSLLKYGADPNLVAGPESESPLEAAVIGNSVGLSHLLLTYNGDANYVTVDGAPLLVGAINKKTPKQLIDLLLGYGSEPNAKSREGKTALFEAIQAGRADIVTSLLDNGADPNLPGPKHMLWPATFYPACLQLLLSHGADHRKCPGILELAASTNNIESVSILLKAKVDPNTRKDGIYTPLCTAIRDDRAELLQLLLANGADPNTKASEYPCFKCVTHDRLHFLPILVAAGGSLTEPKGILETAVASNNTQALNWLLDQGVNPNDKTPKGMSPLTTAIREDRKEMVDLLLLRGADPHMRGQDWPICMAVSHPPILKRILSVVSKPQAFKGVMEMAVTANQLESVKLLIAAGVSVEDKNGGVFSPLTTALRENRREIVHYLLNDGGADVNAPGEHLPVVKALRRFHGEDTEMLELLLEHGADPNKLYRGWNGIMQAVENGDADVLRLLSEKAGVDLEIKDEMGRNVVEMAGSRGWDEAVQILTQGDLRLRSTRSNKH